MEEWKKVDEYDYEVSAFGNVRRIGSENIRKPQPKRNKSGKIDAMNIMLYKDSKGSCKKIHRLVAEAFIPNPYHHPVVDHIDGDAQNNNVSNLRWCSSSQNNCNMSARRNNTSGYKGVHHYKRCDTYMASISLNGKSIHIGTFKTAEEAFEAYKQKADELHGEFAKY